MDVCKTKHHYIRKLGCPQHCLCSLFFCFPCYSLLSNFSSICCRQSCRCLSQLSSSLIRIPLRSQRPLSLSMQVAHVLFPIVFPSLQTISPKYLHKLCPAAYLPLKFLLPYPFQVFPCPGAGMYCFLSGFMAFHA